MIKQGFERTQDNELVLYKDADGWFAVTPQTMEYILNKLDQCKVRSVPYPIEREDVEEFLETELAHK